MSGSRDKIVLGYGFILEDTMISDFKKISPEVCIREVEKTERPTIDIRGYGNRHSKELLTNSIGGSYFRADPGFRPTPKVPSGRKIVSYIDINGLIRYVYGD